MNDLSKAKLLKKPTALIVILVAFYCLGPQGLFGAKYYTSWTFGENQPNIKQGGRADTIAVNPLDNNKIIVATESGGLFRSNDRGTKWSHVDSLPCFLTQAVVYLPSNPNIVLVSTEADFKTNNGGGLWRSTDEGATWTQAVLNLPPGNTARLSGNEISIAPDTGKIFLATSEGVFSSTDSGLTWSFSNVFTTNKKVVSILALSGGRVIAGGSDGLRRSFDGGTTWNITGSNVGALGNGDIHALGRSALSASHLFVVNENTQLFRSEDAGASWTQIASAPPGGGACGGISFIKTILFTTAFNRTLILFFGNRCWLNRLSAPAGLTGTTANYSGTWQSALIDHADTRDIAFINNAPFLLATDGGLHKTSNGGSAWTFVGGGRDGFNALQVTEIKGQYIQSGWSNDIYFGTQDNNLWAANMWGNIWNLYGAEGFFIEMERRVATAADSKVSFVACGGCRNNFSERHFTNTIAWPNPIGSQGSPTIIRNSMYVQPVAVSTTFAAGLALTENSGASWRQFAAFPQSPRDLAKLARSGDGDPLQTTIIYQAFRSNLNVPGIREINRLMRIHKPLFSSENGTVFYPAMNNFGGLGINPTMFAWYQVYGIDPGNAFHVIAPDIVNKKMMETRDGGENWTEIPSLTNLVTDGGRLRFTTDLIGFGNGELFPIVTAVSFSPQNPRIVLVGTSEGGIFKSDDGGATWAKISGTEKITYITSFFWRTANDVHVSTYGRGNWKLRMEKIALPTDFDDLCGRVCDVVSVNQGEGRPLFSDSLLVAEGNILGAKTINSELTEVFVTPGSSVFFTGDTKDPLGKIVVTETEAVDPGGLTALPKPPTGWITKGLVLTNENKLLGAVFGDSEISLVPPVSFENYAGSTISPTAGKPYLKLNSSNFYGVETYLPKEAFNISVRGLVAGAKYEIFIDGATAKTTGIADSRGGLSSTATAPSSIGLHRLEIHPVGDSQTVTDSSMFLVKHSD